MLVCREQSLLKNGALSKSGLGGNFAFKLIYWLQVFKHWEAVLLCAEMTVEWSSPGVWGLGYFGRANATDYTQNCEFFSFIMEG